MAQTLASTSTSTSSNASSHGNYSYHVFLNHRGSDVKKTFASHLYRRLLSYGFRVFLDQQELQRGEVIDSQIERAIATASVHVAILSSGYAQSRWCLDELVLMLKSMESGAATVIPVFYNVKPSDLRWRKEGNDNNGGYAQALRLLRWTGIHRLYTRALRFLMLSLVFCNVNPSDLRWSDKGKNSDRVCAESLRILRQTGRYRVFVSALRILRQTGKDSVYVQALKNISWTSSDRVYAEALLNYEKKGRYSQERLAAWRKALSDVSHISGFELEACNGDEGQLVDEVVRHVQKKVGKAPLHVATHPTRLDETLKRFEKKLEHFEKTVLWERQHNRVGPNTVGIVGLVGVGKSTLAKVSQQKQILFTLEALIEATDNFAKNKKVGEGGFGAVYKGITRDGKKIAMKKLSVGSGQGKREFMNEAELMTNVQHRNLVKLLGSCAEGPEMLLVYEYLPNKSLDTFLFDAEKKRHLDWHKRYNIIMGIARGLLYLHEDSQLRIIHRDIKASNILLDDRLNPKIADFGIARLLPEDETHIETDVAGTVGYMAPEYILLGQVSVKVDVYSFGVLLFEIVTGFRETLFSDEMQSLLEWAWTSYKQGRLSDMIDSTLAETETMIDSTLAETETMSQEEQAVRCLQVALLCTQEDESRRPIMSTVILMISSASVTLANPTKPAFVKSSE